MPLERNLFTLLDRAARSSWASRPAFNFAGRTQTYSELRERSLCVANALLGLGVQKGDRIAVLLGNRFEWPETLFGIAAMGGVCVPVNVLLRPEEVTYLCEDSGSTVLITDELGKKAIAEAEGLPQTIIALDDVTGTHAYDEIVKAAAPDAVEGPSIDDLAMLYYSSGTTGQPKAAAHTHDGMLWNSVHQISDLRLTGDDHYLVLPSLSWAAGFNDLVLALMFVGGQSTLLPTGGMSTERLATAFEESGASHALLVPTLLKQLLDDADSLARIRNTSLRWIVSGAEPVPLAVIAKLQTELPDCQVVQGYGMSEFPTITTILQPEDAVAKVGTAGRAVSVAQLAIQLDDGTIVDVGEGEILLRSPATMVGYHNRPEETAAAFADGWFHTGDIGRLDEAGYLTITGRKKDMIISGGLNVYPREAEEVLYRIDAIAEAAVVGVPDEKWGEIAVAIVVPTASVVDESEVLELCRERLASYKCPRRVLIHEDPLPRTLSGKVLKRELRPWAEEQLRVPSTPPEVPSA